MPNKEKEDNNKNNKECRHSLEETCCKNSQKRINLNSLLNKREEWKSRNTNEKSKGYGKKDCLLIDLKKKDSNNNTPKLLIKRDGKKNKLQEKSKDS